MVDEFGSLEIIKMWQLVQLPERRKTIKTKRLSDEKKGWKRKYGNIQGSSRQKMNHTNISH